MFLLRPDHFLLGLLHHTTTTLSEYTLYLQFLSPPSASAILSTLFPRLGLSPGVHARKRNSCAIVVPTVQLRDRHHITHLGILVGPSAIKRSAVGHGDGIEASILQSFERSEIRPGVDESASDRVGVACDVPHYDAPHMLCFFHVVD